MSTIPADLRFAASHEWARLEADGSVTVGISDHAQEALGDVVFVELPEVGAELAGGQEAGVVESVKVNLGQSVKKGELLGVIASQQVSDQRSE